MRRPDPSDILIQISVCNRGPEAAALHVLPTLWFRNTWTWWPEQPKPSLRRHAGKERGRRRGIDTPNLAVICFIATAIRRLLFTENETNNERIFGTPNATPYVKDGINNYVVAGRAGRRQPGPDRDQGGRALPAQRRGRAKPR